MSNDHGDRGPQRHILRLHCPLAWFCDGRGKRGALVEKGNESMAEKNSYNVFLMFF